MTRLRPAALFAFLLFASLLGTSALAATPPPITGLRGAPVTPRVITFRDLPRRGAPYQGPVLERPESHGPPEIEQRIEQLKQHPEPPNPASQHQLTIESAQQLGPLVGSSRVDLQACKLEYSIVSPK